MMEQTERGRQVRRNLVGIVLPAEERPLPAGSSGVPRYVVAPPVIVPYDPEDVPAVYPPSLADGGVKTMSSLEIAEVTGKEHFHVMRDIRTILEEAGINASKFGGIYRDARNREKPCYHLPRRECDLVVSGYSVPYRLAIIDRWHELEAKEAVPRLPQTRLEAMRELVAVLEKNEEQARLLSLSRNSSGPRIGVVSVRRRPLPLARSGSVSSDLRSLDRRRVFRSEHKPEQTLTRFPTGQVHDEECGVGASSRFEAKHCPESTSPPQCSVNAGSCPRQQFLSALP